MATIRPGAGSLLLLASFGLGAGLMYMFDPTRGRTRRAKVRDKAIHTLRRDADILGKARRDAAHRVHGAIERLRHPLSSDVPDAVLEGRIRARLGRLVSHPASIELGIQDGCVVLCGPILQREARALVRAIETIPGVHTVVDGLDKHATADNVPGLQGEGHIRRPWPTRDEAPLLIRVALVGAGGLLAAWGLVDRRRLAGSAAAAVGGALMVRGVANMTFARLVGIGAGRGAIDIHKTITVHAPVAQVFDLWKHVEGFPRFMEHVRSVRVDGNDPRRSHWEVDGPAGATIAFDAELTAIEPNRLIAWKTLPNPAIEHRGIVQFEAVGAATRVHVDMYYRPPGGVLGHAVARLLGADPKARIDDDLVRMKGLLEHGATRAHGEHVALDEVQPAAGVAARRSEESPAGLRPRS